MFRKIVTICLTAFLYVTADAQDFWEVFKTKDLDVEGIMINHKINYGQFVDVFGNPDEYERMDTYITGGVYESEETYRIGGNQIVRHFILTSYDSSRGKNSKIIEDENVRSSHYEQINQTKY